MFELMLLLIFIGTFLLFGFTFVGLMVASLFTLLLWIIGSILGVLWALLPWIIVALIGLSIYKHYNLRSG